VLDVPCPSRRLDGHAGRGDPTLCFESGDAAATAAEGIAGIRMTSEDTQRIDAEPALLRIESGMKRWLVPPEEAIRIRDGLRREGDQAGIRLATIIDAKATELLAAPMYARTVSVRLDVEEEASLRVLLAAWAADGTITVGAGALWHLWGQLRSE
jgi:hypothetical protein